ncbi:MAG: copper-binding protein [Bacteroidota bacterium]|nr:copper-binding protein [Bacteroidota bacterium]MDP4242575.1 copper-binding protein [Bacteroidota bacterium]MDP4288089.1 copper-binding protein [Bacteroidota bacterium]
MNKLTTFLAAASILTLAACSKNTSQSGTTDSAATPTVAAAPVKQGTGLGKVQGMDTALHTITLAHNDIPGIMDAMTMEYTLGRPELARGLASGDSVRFTLQEPTTGTFVVSSIEKLPK